MEAGDSSGENLNLLSVTEDLPDDVIFMAPLSPPLPSLEDHLWMDPDSELSMVPPKEKTLVSPVKTYDSLIGEAESMFETELKNLSLQGFKCHDDLTGHMLTHQMRKSHFCTQLSWQREFCVQHSLEPHCASQHGASNPSTSSPTEPSMFPWNPSQSPVMTEDHSISNYDSLFLSNANPAPVSQLEQYACSEAGYSGYTWFAPVVENLGLNFFPEEPSLSQVKLPVTSEDWSLEAVDLPPYLDTLTSSQSATSLLKWPGSIVVDPMQPKRAEAEGWENLDIPVTNLQSSKELLSVQPCKQLASAGMEDSMRPCSTLPEKNQILLQKHSCRQLKPQNKQGVVFISGAKTHSKSHSDLGSGAPPSPHQKDPNVLPPQSKSKNRCKKKKKTKSDIVPASPLQIQRSSTQKHGWSYPTSLLSPSQDGAAGQIYESQSFQLSPQVIPVSVPILGRETSFSKSSAQSTERQQIVKGLSKKSCDANLTTLIIPNLSDSNAKEGWAAGSYPSQLRSPTYLADHLLKPCFQPSPYTPPPMLSPLRSGTGLYFTTLPQCQPCPSLPSSYTTSLDEKDMISLNMDNAVVSLEPRINVGPIFQAEIPPLQNRLLAQYDEHPAQLVWAPWGDLPSNPETQQKVTEFVNMCCSSVLPGGGTNTELAIHCLHEVQGDLLAAVDLLLVRRDFRISAHPLCDYHYAGTDHWTSQEKKLFQKALLTHNKDFWRIHNLLQTKSVAQCVEYYYTMKKLKKFKLGNKEAESQTTIEEKSGIRSGNRRALNRPKGKNEG